MQRRKNYRDVLFSVETVRAAVQSFLDLGDIEIKGVTRELARGDDHWSFQSDEEYFAEYRGGFTEASLSLRCSTGHSFRLSSSPILKTAISVSAPSRSDIEKVIDVFERAVESGNFERFERVRKDGIKKSKEYADSLFSAEALKNALSVFESLDGVRVSSKTRELKRGQEGWEFDTDEEFFAEYMRGFDGASLMLHCDGEYSFRVTSYEFMSSTSVSIKAQTRAEVEQVFWEFDRVAESSRVAHPEKGEARPSPSIFIGHGRSAAWRDLKDHLVEQQGYWVQAYETGARSGHTIRDILGDLLNSTSFAILVLTGEDELSSGDIRARQNVVHELGLFQGRLGFPRAIAVVEEGIDLFSNMDGVQQIRFSKGEIRQVFGDVLATLRREFGDSR